MNSMKQIVNQNCILRTGAFMQCTMEKYPILVLFSLEVWFRLRGPLKSQSNSFSMSIQEAPLGHEVIDGVLCVTRLTRITWIMFYCSYWCTATYCILTPVRLRQNLCIFQKDTAVRRIFECVRYWPHDKLLIYLNSIPRSLYLFIRRVIKQTVVIVEAYHCCSLRTKYYPTSCYQGQLHMQRKLLGIFNVDFDGTDQLLIIYSAFVKYLRKNGNTVRQCNRYL
jgi:hypothetical protein